MFVKFNDKERMNNKLLAYLFSLLFICGVAKADVNYGVSLMFGEVDTSGHELESGSASDKNSKSITESFVGGSLFIEANDDNGFAIGLDYVPVGLDIGDGKRTDSSSGADDTSEADTGDRSASAEIKNLFTLYTNVPVGSSGYYGILGLHFTTVSTDESLPNSKYGDEDLFGLQLGLGMRSGNLKYELSYSDFEDISISGSGGNTGNKIEADADAIMIKIAYGF